MNRRAAVLACVLLAGCSSKSEPPANTYKNDAFGFSIVPPPGWTMVTADSAPDFLRKYGDRLLTVTQDALRSPVNGKTTWVVAWVKTDSSDAILPILSVTHNSVGLPQVGNEELQKSRAMVRQKTGATGWRDFTEEQAQLTEVDGLKAVDLTYAGTVERHYIRVGEYMVPSRSMTHFVSLHGEIANWAEYSKLLGSAIYSFRSFGKR